MKKNKITQISRFSSILHFFATREGFVVGLILILSAFLRLYKIREYMTFLGDEGRDVLVVKHILEGNLVGLGPTASVGGFFLGPLYYYMMAPFLWLTHLDPVGPAIMIALFGVATVFLMYYFGKKYFDTPTALISSFLFAIAPLVLAYSRSSWNPNSMPFFTLLLVWFLYKSLITQSKKYFFIIGLIYGTLFQLHYITTFLGVFIVLALLLFDKKWKQFIVHCGLIFGGFIITMSAFLGFEVKHGFPNTRSVLNFMFGGTGETGFVFGKYTTIVGNVLFQLWGRVLTNYGETIRIDTLTQENGIILLWGCAIIIVAILSIGNFIRLYRNSFDKPEKKLQYSLIALWLFVSVLLFGFYKKPIYTYYLLFLYPLPFWFTAKLLVDIAQARTGKIIACIVGFLIVTPNVYYNQLRYPPNNQVNQMETIANFVLEKANGQPFNFALITGGNSDFAYRFFFEKEGNTPVTIQNTVLDPNRKSVTNQLFVVCESLPCQPLGNSLWEIAGFGRGEIEGKWDVSVVQIYMIGHYKGEATPSAQKAQ